MNAELPGRRHGRPSMRAFAALLLAGLAASHPALAGNAGVATATVDKGDVAWMLTSTLLVLLMTVPGLALFYGGMVRSKNVLSVLVQCFAITAVISLIWVIIGYSIAFDTSGSMNKYVGGFGRLFLKGLTVDSLTLTIPETVFIAFQCTFAIITPALIIGAFAERIKFSALILFSVLWFTFGYLPIAHMVWAAGGYLFALRRRRDRNCRHLLLLPCVGPDGGAAENSRTEQRCCCE